MTAEWTIYVGRGVGKFRFAQEILKLLFNFRLILCYSTPVNPDGPLSWRRNTSYLLNDGANKLFESFGLLQNSFQHFPVRVCRTQSLLTLSHLAHQLRRHRWRGCHILARGFPTLAWRHRSSKKRECTDDWENEMRYFHVGFLKFLNPNYFY